MNEKSHTWGRPISAGFDKIKYIDYLRNYIQKNTALNWKKKDRFNNLTKSKIDHLNLIIELIIITWTTTK
jgi:hypothetical protein